MNHKLTPELYAKIKAYRERHTIAKTMSKFHYSSVTIVNIKNSSSFEDYLRIVDEKRNKYPKSGEKPKTQPQTKTSENKPVVKVHPEADNLSGYMGFNEKQKERMEFLLWRFYQRDLPEKYRPFDVLELVVKEAKTPEEVMYLTYMVARRIQKDKE